MSETRLMTVKGWAKEHPWPSEGGLRHLIFHAEKKGFNRVIRKIGRRVLIDENEFFKWVDSHKDPTYGNPEATI